MEEMIAEKKSNISISNAEGSEGGNITFEVKVNPSIATEVSFNYKVVFDNPLTPSSASAADLSGTTEGRAIIAANNDSITIAIAIKDDDIRESAETFNIVLSDLSGSNITFTNNAATGTIAANDPIEINISNARANEGENIIFKVTANQTITEPISFNYRVDFSGQTANANDLSSGITGISTIAANSSITTISIEVVDDIIRENDETFRHNIK